MGPSLKEQQYKFTKVAEYGLPFTTFCDKPDLSDSIATKHGCVGYTAQPAAQTLGSQMGMDDLNYQGRR
jgi:hypothetical protein